MTKTWTCRRCGRSDNPEWASECQCGACSTCGEMLQTTADPYADFEAREPHRATHLDQP